MTRIAHAIAPLVLAIFASTMAIAQTAGGLSGPSAPSATSPSTPGPNTGAASRGLSPGVTDPRTGTPLPPNSGPNTPDPSTYSNHPGTMPSPSPNGQSHSFTPQPARAQPGQASSRPGAAQSANSDGYAECMAMWNPQTNPRSREEWSGTCERARLPPR
jgi:hypothetical protein